VKCCFCGKEVESIEEAVEQGWCPEFWRGTVSYQGPVCAQCQEEHLDTDTDGEYVLKPHHPLPAAAEPQGVARLSKGTAVLVVPPKFELGQVVATPEALRVLEESGQSPGFFLDRHIQADWGEVCDDDKRLNDQALLDGSRLLSAYRTLKGVRLWIITEAVGDDGKRAATTVLLPSQY
jgi:hypothetical protein